MNRLFGRIWKETYDTFDSWNLTYEAQISFVFELERAPRTHAGPSSTPYVHFEIGFVGERVQVTSRRTYGLSRNEGDRFLKVPFDERRPTCVFERPCDVFHDEDASITNVSQVLLFLVLASLHSWKGTESFF